MADADRPVVTPATPTPAAAWGQTAWVAGVLGCVYALLAHPSWVPGGDSELYTAAARAILRGEGYTYNGQAVALAPPGWPLVLSGLMAVSDAYLWLKGVTAVMMLIAHVLAHRVLLRLVPPTVATVSTVLAATTTMTFSLTFWLHSEALFCLLSWAGALAAVKLAEGTTTRAARWLAVVVVACCCAAAAVRWTGPLQWLIVGALLAGTAGVGMRTLRTRTLPWAVSLLSLLAAVLTFCLLYFGLPALADPPQVHAGDTGVDATDREQDRPNLLDNRFFDGIPAWQEVAWRVAGAGRWTSWTLWYPTRFASGIGPFDAVSLAAGWAALALLTVAAVTRIRPGARWAGHRVWVWAATLATIFVLAAVWPLPNARYLVPVAPLLVAGVAAGCAALPRGRVIAAVFFASMAVVNGALLAGEIVVQRSGGGFYDTYETGQHASLVSAAAWLRDRGVRDDEVAVSDRYWNLGRMRMSRANTRNVHLLLDRRVVTVPPPLSFPPHQHPPYYVERRQVPAGGFSEWAEAHGVRYFLYHQPGTRWRLWHVRVPMRVQAYAQPHTRQLEPWIRSLLDPGGESSVDPRWVLYTADDDFRRPVELPPATPVTRVPREGRP